MPHVFIFILSVLAIFLIFTVKSIQIVTFFHKKTFGQKFAYATTGINLNDDNEADVAHKCLRRQAVPCLEHLFAVGHFRSIEII